MSLRSLILRIFYRLLYYEFSWAYDWVSNLVSVGRWKNWVLAALPHLEIAQQGNTLRILEIGHGPGHLLRHLCADGVWVVGMDLSYSMSRYLFLRLMDLGIVPMLVSGYAQFMPFKNNSFDRIVATFPSEYITDPQTLTGIYRILQPGGALVTIPLAWIKGGTLLDRIAAWLFRITRQAPQWDPAWSQPFENAGFEVRILLQDIQQSTVLIIIAKKPDHEC